MSWLASGAVRNGIPALLCSLFVVGAGAAHAQGTVLHATVADANTGNYLLDARVTLEPIGVEAMTDFFGDARFAALRKGRYTVHARRIGYAAISTEVDVTGRDSAEITFMMRPLGHELATVTVEETAVSPFLKEFEERRRQGKGQYIVDSVLRASFPSPLEDVLNSRIRGLVVRRDLNGYLNLSSARGSNNFSGGCPISVYWNGVRITNKHTGPVIDIPEAFIGGIEFYNPGQTPAQYQEPGNDCGVLLLWPRP